MFWLFPSGACQKKELVRKPKPVDVVTVHEPEPPPVPQIPMELDMTVDATPEVEVEPVPAPDPVESMILPEDAVERARLFYSFGYGASAVQLLKTLPKETLGQPEVQLLLGQASGLGYRHRDALAACRKAENGPKELKLQALICQAQAHLALKEHAAALRLLEGALVLEPDNMQVRYGIMEILVQLKSRDALAKMVGETLARRAEDPATLLYQGMVHELGKSSDKAFSTYEKLTLSDEIPPWVEAEAFDRMGMLMLKSNPAKSREILSRCRQRVPGAGCPRTELALSPPDPRHPERRIRNVQRPGRTNPMVPTTP